MMGLDFTRFKRIIFDFGSLNTTKPQGQVFLEFLGKESMFKLISKEYLNKEMIQKLYDRYSQGYGEHN